MADNITVIIITIVVLVGIGAGLSYFLTTRFGMKKMKRSIMKAEHNYQQQIANLQQQLSAKVVTLESMVDKLRLNNQELNRLNEIKNKFMSVVAHDLKQPLTSIQGLTSVLMMDGAAGGGNQDQQALNNILKATDNMNTLMADLMDISMIDSGHFNMSFKEFDFNGLVNDIYALQQVNAQKKGLTFVQYPYPTVITVSADRFRISQVLNNLASNAIKFTHQDGRIEMRYQPYEDKVFFSITDSGYGIPHDEKQKVFQKFHQSDATRKLLKKQGWGLGLNIAQEIIHAHNGIIGVDSAGAGQGSTFWLTIPLKREV